jgi:peptidoglycan L-alanyl-D-glutamate endopeptidase CwlK
MYKLSKKSLSNLDGVHPSLVDLVKIVMNWQVMDFSVAEGIRTEDRQKELVASGKSKTMNSKHLRQSTGYGHAVDLYPYPIDMEKVNKGDVREISRFSLLAGLVIAAGKSRGVKVTWGGDWDRDGQKRWTTRSLTPRIFRLNYSQ